MAVGKGLFLDQIKQSDIDRFKAKIISKEDCWLTCLYHDKKGYPKLWLNKKQRMASNFFYVISKKDLPAGLLIMHSCDNPACVNPDHLFEGTDKDNAVDRDNKNRNNSPTYENKIKTHCKYGHEFTKENTLIRKRKEGGRKCRECHRIRSLKNYHSGTTK